MKWNDLKSRKYLAQDDVGDKARLLTMSHIGIEAVGWGDEQEDKPILYFQETKKGMVLNHVNRSVLEVDLAIDTPDAVEGVKVVLYVDPNVTFGNKRVGGLRLRKPSVNQPDPTAESDDPFEPPHPAEDQDNDPPF
jgi:hypothetical protein